MNIQTKAIKNLKIWVLGLLFLIIFICLSFNENNWTLFVPQKKEKTNAYVINLKIGYGNRGFEYMQIVEYVFVVDGKIYDGRKKIGKNYKRQHIGNTLTVSYSVKNPIENEVTKFNNEYYSKVRVYFSHRKVGYSQINLVNGVYFFKNHGLRGLVLDEDIGTYEENTNTLTLKSFLKKRKENYIIKGEELVNLNTGIIYK